MDTVKKELATANAQLTFFTSAKARATRNIDRSIVDSLPNRAWGVVYRVFNTIPEHVVEQILGHVHVSDVPAIARICRRFRVCVKRVIPVVMRRSGNDIADTGKYLVRFVQKGNLDGVKGLIVAGADVNLARTDIGETPLHIATSKGHVDVVKELIAAGADVSLA